MKTSVSAAIRGLIRYGEERGLIEESDRIYCFNRLLEMLKLDGPDGEDETAEEMTELFAECQENRVNVNDTCPWQRRRRQPLQAAGHCMRRQKPPTPRGECPDNW